MIEVKIPAEIQDYKSKLIAGLSIRQCIAIAGIFVTCVPITVFGIGHIPADILFWIAIAFVVPFVGWGWFTFKDMRFEIFVKSFFAMNFLPQRRIYEDTDVNIFCVLHEEMIENDTIYQKIENGDYEIGE